MKKRPEEGIRKKHEGKMEKNGKKKTNMKSKQTKYSDARCLLHFPYTFTSTPALP